MNNLSAKISDAEKKIENCPFPLIYLLLQFGKRPAIKTKKNNQQTTKDSSFSVNMEGQKDWKTDYQLVVLKEIYLQCKKIEF